MRMLAEEAHRQLHGEVLVKADDRDWTVSRQGYIKFYLHPSEPQTVLQDWKVFVQDIQKHSGRHTHQGGLVIYVWEGTGYTVMDGERYDWEEGDLMVLPIKPGGVEHQHFNNNPELGCKWIAFIYTHFQTATGTQIVQHETSSAYREQANG